MKSYRKFMPAIVLIAMVFLFTVVLQVNAAPQIQLAARTSYDDFTSRNETRQSLTQLDTLLKLEPWSNQYRTQRARAYLQLGDTQSAMADLATLFDHRNIDSEGVLLLAALHLQSGHVSTAE